VVRGEAAVAQAGEHHFGVVALAFGNDGLEGAASDQLASGTTEHLLESRIASEAAPVGIGDDAADRHALQVQPRARVAFGHLAIGLDLLVDVQIGADHPHRTPIRTTLDDLPGGTEPAVAAIGQTHAVFADVVATQPRQIVLEA